MKMYAKGFNTEFKYAVGATDIYGKTFHDSYELFLHISGSVEYVCGSTRQFLKPYQLVVIPKGSYHQFIVGDDGEDYERYVMNISPLYPDEAVLKKAFEDKSILNLSENHRIVQNFMYLKECMGSADTSDLLHIIDAVATDTVFVIKNIRCEKQELHGSLRSLSVEVMEYINVHFNEINDIDRLALLFHISESSLWHTFKSDFGISIKKYIMQKRMNAAYSAIKSGMSAQEAAQLCGYKNYSAFYRCYMAYYGHSPSGDVDKRRK